MDGDGELGMYFSEVRSARLNYWVTDDKYNDGDDTV